MHPRGRYWVILWLLVFLAVAAIVVARQSDAIRTARRLREVRQERAVLEARHAELTRRIREAASRRVLVPKAERDLGLREPEDWEWETLTPQDDSTAGEER